MIADESDVRQLADRESEGFTSAEDGVADQNSDRSRELRISFRFKVPGLERRQVVVVRTRLRPSMESGSRSVTKPIDDRDGGAVISAGTVPKIDDESFKILEVIRDIVQRSDQLPFLYVFQFKDPHVPY